MTLEMATSTRNFVICMLGPIRPFLNSLACGIGKCPARQSVVAGDVFCLRLPYNGAFVRKLIINPGSENVSPTNQNWLDLEPLAQVEITSEDVGHPIESALIPGRGSGWRAAGSGEQIIRLLFDKPLNIRRIHLLFCEDQHERTQEFVLRWSSDHGQSYREIVRQQYNFSPLSATREVEDYGVDLDGVTALELRILPDVRRGSACGSLTEWFLA